MRLNKFFVLLILAVKSYPQIDRVEPPNWWVGMEHNEIQILFYGVKISEFFPKLRNLNSSEVFISKIKSLTFEIKYLWPSSFYLGKKCHFNTRTCSFIRYLRVSP